MFCPTCGSMKLRGARIATDDLFLFALITCAECQAIFDAYREFGAGPANIADEIDLPRRRVSLMGVA
jgi:hypothetical protein